MKSSLDSVMKPPQATPESVQIDIQAPSFTKKLKKIQKREDFADLAKTAGEAQDMIKIETGAASQGRKRKNFLLENARKKIKTEIESIDIDPEKIALEAKEKANFKEVEKVNLVGKTSRNNRGPQGKSNRGRGQRNRGKSRNFKK